MAAPGNQIELVNSKAVAIVLPPVLAVRMV
jgi:hypothetical protein